MYARHNPIDDQANHHVPIASLQATVSNLLGGDRVLTDYLLYRDREEQSSDAWIAAWFTGAENDGG